MDSTQTLTLLFTVPSIVATSTVEEHSPTTRSTNAPAEPVTAVQLDESDHATRDAGTSCCSTRPSEKRTSICSVTDADSGAPSQLVATSPPVRATQSEDTIDSDALTTFGTSRNASSEPLKEHRSHATEATVPQNSSGFAPTVSVLPLTASDACAAVTSKSDVFSGSTVPSVYSSNACTAALSPSCWSDCVSDADAECCDALSELLEIAAARSCTSPTSALDTVTFASETPATRTSSTPSAVGRSERSALSYTSEVPVMAAIAVTLLPSASTRTPVL
jgi:hypothetical protein